MIAPGVRAPYPQPSSAAASAIGRGNKRRDTKPEVALRSALHRRGHRFRVDHVVVTPDRRVRVDIAFTRAKVAVFVDGCFWHGCPDHQRVPRTNQSYWIAKLEANRRRDSLVTESLRRSGWRVVRIWEHEVPEEAVAMVELGLAGQPERRWNLSEG